MTSPDDFDTGNLDAPTEDAATETPSEPSTDSSSSDEPSDPVIEIEEEQIEPIDDSNASADGDDGWEGDPPSDETNESQEQEPQDEVLAEIVDPRLATVEGGSILDPSVPDPRVVTEEAREPEPVVTGPSVAELQAELARVTEERDFAHSCYQSAVIKLQAAEEAGSHIGVTLANELAQRQEVEAALRDTQAALLDASMKASNLDSELTATRTELVRVERDLAALGKRSVFQIIPAHKKGQARDTRVYVLADDAADAIRRVEKAGVIPAADVENITKTSQKLVI